MTADEVVSRIESTWKDLDELVSAMDAQTLSAPGPEHWAVKDHLVHVGAWEHWLLALFERRDKLAAMGAAGADKQIDDVNAVVYAKHRDDTVEQALAYFHDAHEQLMAVLRSQSTEDFQRPYKAFFDSGHETTELPVLGAVAGNTYDHYAEHAQWIKDLTASLERR